MSQMLEQQEAAAQLLGIRSQQMGFLDMRRSARSAPDFEEHAQDMIVETPPGTPPGSPSGRRVRARFEPPGLDLDADVPAPVPAPD
eukprot:16325499-Heterocapsa_arctica.AAC.1